MERGCVCLGGRGGVCNIKLFICILPVLLYITPKMPEKQTTKFLSAEFQHICLVHAEFQPMFGSRYIILKIHD